VLQLLKQSSSLCSLSRTRYRSGDVDRLGYTSDARVDGYPLRMGELFNGKHLREIQDDEHEAAGSAFSFESSLTGMIVSNPIAKPIKKNHKIRV
jgi:hypothetical protein